MAQPEAAPDKAIRKVQRQNARADARAAREGYLTLQLGSGLAQTLDARIAENRYIGLGTMISSGWLGRNPRRMLSYSLESRVLTFSQLNMENIGFNSYNQGRLAYLRALPLKGSQPGSLYLGGELSLLVNARILSALGNSAINLDLVPSLAAALQYERDVTLRLFKSPLRLDGGLRLPLLSYVLRLPQYGLSGLGGISSALAPVGDFTRVVTELGFGTAFSPRNPNRWRFAYQWDFYAYSDLDIHPLRVAQHALILQLSFNGR
jgi:hypothetical protein